MSKKKAGVDPTTSFWLDFFKEAGIPPEESKNHAVTFVQNRIRADMLMDLNKEYLNDMGITMMGDIIAILKHAKLTHTKTSRENALKGSETTSTETGSPRRSTPASRIVNHYLDKYAEARPMNESPPPPRTGLSQDMQARLGSSSTASSGNAAGRISPVVTVSLGDKGKEEVPVPKVRRVLPEHEGKYKVTMPAGTTARSRRLLKKAGKSVAQGGSVFDRLGQTDEVMDSSPSPTVTVTGLDSVKLKSSNTKGSSVFNRLGGKTAIKRPATSTSQEQMSASDDEDKPDVSCEYAGVLKTSTAKRRALVQVKKKIELAKKKAAAAARKKAEVAKQGPKTEGILSPSAFVAQRSLRDRLGPKSEMADSTTPGPSAVNITITKPTSGSTQKKSQAVYSRLGPQPAEVTSTQDLPAAKAASSSAVEGGVFKRLGKQILSKN